MVNLTPGVQNWIPTVSILKIGVYPYTPWAIWWAMSSKSLGPFMLVCTCGNAGLVTGLGSPPPKNHLEVFHQACLSVCLSGFANFMHLASPVLQSLGTQGILCTLYPPSKIMNLFHRLLKQVVNLSCSSRQELNNGHQNNGIF